MSHHDPQDPSPPRSGPSRAEGAPAARVARGGSLRLGDLCALRRLRRPEGALTAGKRPQPRAGRASGPSRREAREALVRAFDGDPLFRFLLPEPHKRARWLAFLMDVALSRSLAHGEVLYGRDGAASGAACVVLPRGDEAPSQPSLGAALRLLASPRHPSPGWPTRPILRWGLPLLARVEAAHLAGPHLYLAVVGVSPDHQGRGLGGDLLRRVLALAEERALVAYLETSNPVNLPLYRRHGFEVRDELVIGPGVPPVWTMATT
jgi:ribosomal protein S18 acetylase RimI-like enzyme